MPAAVLSAIFSLLFLLSFLVGIFGRGMPVPQRGANLYLQYSSDPLMFTFYGLIYAGGTVFLASTSINMFRAHANKKRDQETNNRK